MEQLGEDFEGQFRVFEGDRVELEGSRSLGLLRTSGGSEGCKDGTVEEISDTYGTTNYESNQGGASTNPPEGSVDAHVSIHEMASSQPTVGNPTTNSNFESRGLRREVPTASPRLEANGSRKVGENVVENVSSKTPSEFVQHELMDPEGSEQPFQEPYLQNSRNGPNEELPNEEAVSMELSLIHI